MDRYIAAFSRGVKEIDEQCELLARTVGHLDQLADADVRAELLDNFLNWLAHFTREHFGFQQRLIRSCGDSQELLRCMAAHNDLRKRLSDLCLDALRRDATVATRLRDLGHQLLADVQTRDRGLLDHVRSQRLPVSFRRGRRAHTTPLTASWAELAALWQGNSSRHVQ
jgi:hemerythrin